MAGFSTAFMPNSFKQEVFQAVHNFSYITGLTASAASGSNHYTSLSTNVSANNVVVGLLVTGTNVAANSYVSFISTAGTDFYVSNATGAVANATGTITTGALTFAGDDIRVALGIGTPTGTYNASTAAWGSSAGSPTTTNFGTDELATGSGYTAGGYDITAANNVTPTLGSGTAYTTPGVNPSWTSATFTTSGCLMYNNSKSTRAVYVSGFGGSQSVSAGTFTILMPSNTNTTALLRIA